MRVRPLGWRPSRIRTYSGRPSDRRKGSGIRSALEEVLDRKVPATVDGEHRRGPLTKAGVLQLAQKAPAGDVRSIREVLKIAAQVPASALRSPRARPRCLSPRMTTRVQVTLGVSSRPNETEVASVLKPS